MARKQTTGRFDTRAELEARVLHLHHNTRMKVAAIARYCHISATVARRIIEKAGRQTNDHEFQVTLRREFFLTVTVRPGGDVIKRAVLKGRKAKRKDWQTDNSIDVTNILHVAKDADEEGG